MAELFWQFIHLNSADGKSFAVCHAFGQNALDSAFSTCDLVIGRYGERSLRLLHSMLTILAAQH
jgi:hypothetical protein